VPAALLLIIPLKVRHTHAHHERHMSGTMRSTMSSILCHLRAGKGILKTARECGVGKRYGVQRIAEEK
jgi:hypothetical protein